MSHADDRFGLEEHAAVTVVTSGGASATAHMDHIWQIMNILGKRDCRMFLPLFETDPADDESVQDMGQRGNHFLKHTLSAVDPYIKGELLAYILNGSDEAIDMVDDDQFSFGDGADDSPFSVIQAVKLNVVADNTFISRYDLTDEAEEVEYRIHTDGAGVIYFRTWDETIANFIGRATTFAMVADVWYIVIGTYDGSAVNGGFRIFVDGVRLDTTNSSGGAYTAMHNMAVVTSVGYYEDATGVLVDFLDGSVALPAITGRHLSDGGVAEGQPADPLSDVGRLTMLYREVLELI